MYVQAGRCGAAGFFLLFKKRDAEIESVEVSGFTILSTIVDILSL
jgi:hypothetical protein